MGALQEFFFQQYGFGPTEDQSLFLRAFESFMISKKERCALILNGYAGTGKTTLLGAVAKFLEVEKKSFVLMAPTGRAAKVLVSYANQRAFTIHKVIYSLRKRKDGGQYFALKKNNFKNAVFIIDEASMIGEDSGGLTKNALLDDIMEFVFSGSDCRLILVGDEAQLPPVGSTQSPALDKDGLAWKFNLVIAKITLNEVVRQAQESGILTEATYLREEMKLPHPQIEFSLHRDFKYLSAYDFADHYQESVAHYGVEGVVYITRSNKHANAMNRQIRNFSNGSDALLDGGDRLMIVKNNYHWTAAEEKQDFIANGDFCEVSRVRNIDERFGYQFAEASLYFMDYNLELDAKVWLDSILVDQASMPAIDGEKIWHLLDQELMDEIPDRKKRTQMLRENSFVQALQVKFGYAITCHKAQGGQWPIVYVDLGYITEEMMDVNLLRWLYTAITRATEKVYLVNFPQQWLKGAGSQF